MKNLYFLGVGLLFLTANLSAQSINNVQASLSGTTVIITYDLTTTDNGQKFDVEIKSSHDNFTSALKEVTGDVGPNQSAGLSKKVIWDAKKELGKFTGEISFEITATVTFTPMKFMKPTAGSGVKIGKPYSIQWKGGTPDTRLRLELLKNNTSVMDMGNISNTGTYSWNVPKTMEKGENYQFRLLDPSKPNDALLSAQFNLKKTSILIYAIPAAVLVGVGVAVLAGGGGGGEDCTDICNPNCPNYNPSDPSCQVSGEELATPPPPPGGGN